MLKRLPPRKSAEKKSTMKCEKCDDKKMADKDCLVCPPVDPNSIAKPKKKRRRMRPTKI